MGGGDASGAGAGAPEAEEQTQTQEQKRAAAAAYDYEGDARWADYWSNVLVPPHLAAKPEDRGPRPLQAQVLPALRRGNFTSASAHHGNLTSGNQQQTPHGSFNSVSAHHGNLTSGNQQQTPHGSFNSASAHHGNLTSGNQQQTQHGSFNSASAHHGNLTSGNQQQTPHGSFNSASAHHGNFTSGNQQQTSHGNFTSASAHHGNLTSGNQQQTPHGSFTSVSAHHGNLTSGNQQPNNEWLQRIPESQSAVEVRGRGHPSTLAQPALEMHSRNGGAQRGPRIANVVHRFKCSVEPLEIGIVLSGRMWSSSQAIFPKGFRSRVKYFSIVDPMQMAYYVSEILDAGLQGPLFMVTVENCPGEVFINVTPTKCWNMVRERLNMEIRRQLSMGRPNLPTLQPPGSIDGLEMFGLLSPAVVRAIEVQDRDHICTEYWRSRPHVVMENRDFQHTLPQGPANIVLRGLFQRARPDELRALRGLLASNTNLDERSRQQATHMLDEEIAKQWR